MSQFDVALVAYAPNGARLGPLPVPSRITSAVNPLNDMPMLQLDYLESAPGFDLLGSPIEIAVQVYNPSTGTWTEPFNSRYLLIDWDANTASNTGRHTYSCPGYAYNLDKVVTRPRSKSDISEDISQAQAAAASAKAAYSAACAALRTAVGASSKAGVIFASYSPDIVNGAIFVNFDEDPYKVFLGSKPKGSTGSWVAKTGTAIVNAAVNAYEKKLVYDDANAGITRAKNDKSFDREIQAATAGKVMNQLLSEAQARGNRLPGLTWDFSANSDSNGQPWAHLFEEPLVIKAGQSALGVLQNLTDQGMCDWVMEGRELHIYNPDTALMRDRTDVQLLVGTDIKDAPDRGTYGSLTHNILFLGEEGTTFELTNNAPISPWGRWEKSVSQGGVTSRSVGIRLGQAQLDAGAAPRTESTRDLIYRPGRPLPYLDYRVGDTVSSIGGTGVSETMRVRQITLTREPDGTPGGNLVLGDRFLEAEVRNRRQIDGILNGTIPKGDGTIPGTPVIPSERLPEAPYDLEALAQNYADPNGKIIGRLAMDWEWSGTDTNGAPIEGHGFQVQIRPDRPEGVWASAGTANNSEYHLDDVRIRTEGGDVEVYQVRVRTVAYNGRTSEWSDVVTVMMEADITPPPVPSKFTTKVDYATITAAWDGLGAGGEQMPMDFKYVEGEIASDPLGPWALFASFPFAGSMPVPNPTEYGTYWLRGRSVDTSGNYSEYGELAMCVTEPLVNLPEIQDLIDDYEQKFAEAMEEAGIALDSANGKNRVTHSTSLPILDGKEREGDVWWRYSNSMFSVIIGTWQYKDGAYTEGGFGHQVFDSVDAAKISVGFLDSARIRAKSLRAEHIAVGDFTNFASIDPLADVNVTSPSNYATVSDGAYTRKAAGGSNYFMFLDRSAPIPFEESDWIRVTFTAQSNVAVSVTPTLVFYDAMIGDGGGAIYGTPIDILAGTNYYSYDIQVPASLANRVGWTMGLYGAGIRDIGLKNVRAYKKTGATLIAPDSIRTPHLGAEVIESYHIKSNSIETDRLIGGFADFIVITGSTFQTVAAANRGIKIQGGLNMMRAWDLAGEQSFSLNGSSGDVTIGKGGPFRVYGSSGDLDIGNGKFIVDGGTGNVTMSDATLTAANITGSSRVRLDASGPGGYSIAMNRDVDGGYLGFWTPETITEPDVGGTIRCNTTSITPANPPVGTGKAQMVLRSPRVAGVADERCTLWLMSNDVDNGRFDQPTLGIRGDIWFSGNSAVYGDFGVTVDAGAASTLDLGVNASGVRSTVIRDNPYTFASNMYVTSNGYIGQTSSAARFKIDAREMELSDELLEIPVKDWVDKTSHEEAQTLRGLGVRTADQQALLDSGTQEVRVPGVVAEDVEAVAGGAQFVAYNVDGETQGVAYDRLAMAQIAVLKRQLDTERQRNDELEARLAALEEKMENL